MLVLLSNEIFMLICLEIIITTESKEEEASRLHRQQLEDLHRLQRQQEEEKKTDLKRAKFLLIEAMDEDESSNGGEDALNLYLDAAELCLKAVS